MYVVRPVLPTGCKSKADTCARVGVDQPVNLGGFGVELALKNMEYKAIDDSEVKKGGLFLWPFFSEDSFLKVAGMQVGSL